MGALVFFSTYAYWHYGRGLIALLGHIQITFRFLWSFFAIPTLVRTLLAPWRRLQESYPDGFDIPELISTFLINSMMRLVGLVVRLIIICFGLGVLLASGILTVVILALWVFLPVVIGILIATLISLFI
jgi:hypothetical protein